MPSDERTFIILKPDAMQRRLLGAILGRFEERGFKLVGLKMARLRRETLETHYADHRQKPFFQSLLSFMTAGPVVLGVLEGPRAVEVVRKMMGKTVAHQAEPGTIRGDLGVSTQYNLIHGSDSPESARREIELFFKKEELFDYGMPDAAWLKEE
jgi:nucleoside-diphosphate kinase